MKGLSERRVLYGHVFRNAMMIVVSGFPGAFIAAFFGGCALDRNDFFARRARASVVRIDVNRDYPVVFADLYIFALLGLVDQSFVRFDLYVDRSAHRFRNAGGLPCRLPRRRAASRQSLSCTPPARRPLRLKPDQPAPSGEFQSQQTRLLVVLDFSFLFVLSLFSEFIANDKPLLVVLQGRMLFPDPCTIIRKRNLADFSRRPTIATR